MNAVLQRLSDQAQFTGDRYATQEEFADQFAQLLLAEVEQVIWSVDDGALVGTVVQAVRQHFGVDA